MGQLSLDKTFLLAAWVEVTSSNFTKLFHLFILIAKAIVYGDSSSPRTSTEYHANKDVGFFFCIFCATMYIHFTTVPFARYRDRDRHTSVCAMIFISSNAPELTTHRL